MLNSKKCWQNFLIRTRRLEQIRASCLYRHHYSKFIFGGGAQERRWEVWVSALWYSHSRAMKTIPVVIPVPPTPFWLLALLKMHCKECRGEKKAGLCPFCWLKSWVCDTWSFRLALGLHTRVEILNLIAVLLTNVAKMRWESLCGFILDVKHGLKLKLKAAVGVSRVGMWNVCLSADRFTANLTREQYSEGRENDSVL